MHTHMTWWTPQSIGWFVRASERTDYHRLLCDEIQTLLKGCRTILEFGCGLGYESEILFRRGYDISSYDIDENAIRFARERSGLGIFHVGDVNKIDALTDALLCINYGHIEKPDHLESLLRHADRKLVYVISRHSAHGTDTREDRTERIKAILKESGLLFSVRDVALDFDQPLLSMDEARAFIEWTYLGRNTERYLSFVERSADDQYPYIFRNRKELVIFSIEKTGGNI